MYATEIRSDIFITTCLVCVPFFQNGMMSALPYLAIYVLSFPFGYLADLSLKKKWLSITASRKLSNSIGKLKWLPTKVLLFNYDHDFCETHY